MALRRCAPHHCCQWNVTAVTTRRRTVNKLHFKSYSSKARPPPRDGIGATGCGRVPTSCQLQIPGSGQARTSNHKKGASRCFDLPLCRCDYSIYYFLPLVLNSSAPHFLAVASNTSLLDSATGGKSFIHSYGRVASMMARELKPFFVW